MRTLDNGITQDTQELVDIQNVSGRREFQDFGPEVRSDSQFFWVYSVKADTFTLVERYTTTRPPLCPTPTVLEVPRVTLAPDMFTAMCYSIENVEVHRESEGRLDDGWYYRDKDTGKDYEREV